MTELERVVLGLLLEGDDRSLAALRAQADRMKVALRNRTASGFFVHFALPDLEGRLEGPQNFALRDVHGEVGGLQQPVRFLLFVTNGLIDVLQGLAHDEESWSEAAALNRAYHVSSAEAEIPARDLDSACPWRRPGGMEATS